MRQQVGGTAVNYLLGYDMLSNLGKGLNGVGDGCSAGSDCQTCCAALQRGDALFKHALGAVGQTAVDIARVSQAEAVGGVLQIVKSTSGGCVNGNRAGIGGGGRAAPDRHGAAMFQTYTDSFWDSP